MKAYYIWFRILDDLILFIYEQAKGYEGEIVKTIKGYFKNA